LDRAQQELIKGYLAKAREKLLANLKDIREAGDYDALSYIDEETARRAVLEAEEFERPSPAISTD
jgi:hypothetical protein